jgi:DNA-binding transcriptional MocR family regulator
MKHLSAPQAVGQTVKLKSGQWVQTERKTHEAWARLVLRKPRAAALAHHLVAQMGPQNAVVIPQTVLAKLMECSVDTVQRAVRDLVAEKWISVVRLGKGKEAAYVVNDRVAWGERRDKLHLSAFSATVVADFDDQDEALLGHGDLRRIPTLYPGERQLPTGPSEEPTSQLRPSGMESDLPDLPALTETQKLEQRQSRPDEPCFLDDEGSYNDLPTRITLPR